MRESAPSIEGLAPSDEPEGRATFPIAARATIALLVALGACVFPAAATPGRPLLWFLPIVGGAGVLGAAVIAVVFARRRDLRPISTIAAAIYAFLAVIVCAHVAEFVGIPPGHLNGAGWCYLAWHFGLSAGIAAVASRRMREATARGGVASALALGIGVGGLCVIATLVAPLPELKVANAYTDVARAALAFLIAQAVLALIVLRRAAADLGELSPWLQTAIVATLVDEALTAAAGSRFAVGWYLGHVASVAAILSLSGYFALESGRSARALHAAARLLLPADLAETLAHGTPLVLWTARPHGTLQYAAAGGTPLPAAPPARRGARFFPTHADDYETALLRWNAAIRAGAPFDHEFRVRTRRNGYRWVRAHALPEIDQRGGVSRYCGVLFDVDDRRRGEEALRLVADRVADIVWAADPDGTVSWLNAAWYAYTGDVRTASAEPVWTRCAPDARRAAEEAWRISVVTGLPLELSLPLRRADGTERWHDLRAVALRFEDGSIQRWHGTCTDVDAARRRADEMNDLYLREHRIARTLQRAFLPDVSPRLPGVRSSAVYRPATREDMLGGDWYDLFRLSDDRIGVAIGDVTGHGLDAAALMVRARETLRATLDLEPDRPGIALQRADALLGAIAADVSVTAIVGVIDVGRATFTYACAGHPPPILVRDGEAASLAGGGVPLGLEAGLPFAEHVLALQRGDALALYTDGLTEYDRDAVLGERQLLEALRANPRCAADVVADAVLGGTEQRDDVALLLLHVDLDAGVTEERGWRFSSDDASTAHSARAAFTAYLRAAGADPDDVAGAELVFGELVGNVVRHAPGPIEIALTWVGDVPTLHVRDRGKRAVVRPAPGLPADDLSESGRGLFLIEAFAAPPRLAPRAGGGSDVSVPLRITVRPQFADLVR